MKFIRRVLFAIQYLTIVPPREDMRTMPEDAADALPFFPVVGMLVGAIVAALGFAAQYFYPSAALWAAVCVVALFALTGGVHQCALAETCDALLAHARRVKTRDASRNVPLGAMGASAIMLDFLFQFAVMLTMYARGPHLCFVAVIAAQVCSRFAMAVCAAFGTSAAYLDPDKRLVMGADWRCAVFAAAAAALCLLPFFGLSFWVPLLAAGFVAAVATLFFKHMPGGMTGAALGAAHQIAQAFVLTVFLWERARWF